MPAIIVDPPSSRIDKLTRIKVTGLNGGQKFRLRLKSKDAHKVKWRSSDVLTAKSDGTLDVTMYHRTTNSDPMYLFNELAPHEEIPPNEARFYAWAKDAHSWSGPEERRFKLSGHYIDDQDFRHPWATAELKRSAGVSATTIKVKPGKAHWRDKSQRQGKSKRVPCPRLKHGLYGKYFEPATTPPKDAAVLIFGGSEGRLSAAIQVAAGLLATDGYPTLALEYFAPPQDPTSPEAPDPPPPPWDGFPTELSQIPLEYFKGALDWLSHRTKAPKKMFVSGTSRGSEVALLLGANYRDILGSPPKDEYANLGVIANVPSLYVNGEAGPQPNSARHSAWTLGGEEIPFDHHTSNRPDPAAAIPVQQIAGPIFLDGGADDQVWYSGVAVKEILARVNTNGRNPHDVDSHLYQRGGHGLGILVAYLPRAFSKESPPPQPPPFAPPPTMGSRIGGFLHGAWTGASNVAKSLRAALSGASPDENNIIDGDLWPKLRAYLEKHS